MKRLSRALISYIALVILYILVELLAPANRATMMTYHLSVTEYRILVMALSFPIIAVWFATFYGYATLETYSHIIRKTADGKAFGQIAIGLRWLAWGSPIGSIITAILGAVVTKNLKFASTAFIIVHYVPIIVSLVAFTYMSKGTRTFMQIIRNRFSMQAVRMIILALSTIAVLFTYFTIQEVQNSSQSPFYMPLWLAILTIVIPYLYAWFLGLLAAYEILLYSRHTKGLLYKRALNYLSLGTGIAILATIIIQYLGSDTTHLRKVTLNSLLLEVYTLLILYAIGYGLIALGAKRLKKIEEV